MELDRELITIGEIALLAGVNKRTVLRWRKLNILPAPVVDVGKTIRYDKQEITKWMSSNSANQNQQKN